MQQRPFVTNNVLPSGIADQYELLVFQTARQRQLCISQQKMGLLFRNISLEERIFGVYGVDLNPHPISHRLDKGEQRPVTLIPQHNANLFDRIDIPIDKHPKRGFHVLKENPDFVLRQSKRQPLASDRQQCIHAPLGLEKERPARRPQIAAQKSGARSDQHQIVVLVLGQCTQILRIAIRHLIAHIDFQIHPLGLGPEETETLPRIIGRIQQIGIGSDRIVNRRHRSVFQTIAIKQIGQLQEQRPVLGIGKRDQDAGISVCGVMTPAVRAESGNLIDQDQRRIGHKRGKERHDHEYHEQRRGDDPHLVTDVQHDQLHQSPCIHQHADRQTVFPRLPDRFGRTGGPDHLSQDGNGNKTDTYHPQMGRIQQADLGSQSGENEKQGEEEYQCHVFDLFGHHPSETEIRRHDYTREKRTEQSMNTQNLRNIRRHDHDQKDEAHQCLADGLLTVVALPEPTHEGLYHEEHEEDITSRQ